MWKWIGEWLAADCSGRDKVPSALLLELVVSTLPKKKTYWRTVTSMRAQWGTLVPAGTRLGKLRANYHVEGNRSSEETGNSPPGSQNFIAVLDKFLIANVRCMSPIIWKEDDGVYRTWASFHPGTRCMHLWGNTRRCCTRTSLNADWRKPYTRLPGEEHRWWTLRKTWDDKARGRNKNKEYNSQPPWQVEIRYAATVHQFWPKLLTDWTIPRDQMTAKECNGNIPLSTTGYKPEHK